MNVVKILPLNCPIRISIAVGGNNEVPETCIPQGKIVEAESLNVVDPPFYDAVARPKWSEP